MLSFQRAAFDSGLAPVVDLMRATFPHAKKFTPDYLSWLYLQNPVGPLLGTHVYEDGELIGQIAGIPQNIRLKGEAATAVLLLDVAVHEKARGRGLFLQGVQHTIDIAKENGASAIIGVANANTWKGYEKLGFQIVSSLNARIVTRAPTLETMWGLEAADLFRDWDDDTLTWRMANPRNPLQIEGATEQNVFITGRSPYPGIRATATIPRRSLKAKDGERSLMPSLLIELSPPESISYGASLMPIPEQVMPSPLKLIYYNLDDPADRLEPNAVFFSFLDFDAY